MEIFINSTFDQSVKGFRLMKLGEDNRFSDVFSGEEIPSALYGFFSEDLFLLTLCDFPSPVNIASDFRFLCFRGIKGRFNNGKNGVIETAIICHRNDWEFLNRIVLLYLHNRDLISKILFQAVSVDAKGDYSLDREAFVNSVTECAWQQEYSRNILTFVNEINEHLPCCFGLYFGSSDRALEILSSSLQHEVKKKSIISLEDFYQKYC